MVTIHQATLQGAPVSGLHVFRSSGHALWVALGEVPMERPYPPPKENKLLLLYVFQKVGAMTNLQVMRFIIGNGLMDYLDLQLTLAELTDSGLLQVLPVDDNRYYTLTTRAQQLLELLLREIPASRRDTIDQNAETWRTLFLRERQMTADYIKNSAGDYTVRLVAREAGSTLVDIKISVATLSQAKQICSTWNDRAAVAYRALMEALTEEALQESLSSPPDSM